MAAGLIDEVTVTAQAGDGGNGAASFHREKYRPKGGPDGGDGGNGGSIVLIADPAVETLADFRLRRRLRAPSGAHGSSRRRRGRNGKDLRVRVPPGTIVRDARSREVLADLAHAQAAYVAARGGNGGRGNASLTSSVERAPNFAERGEPGEEAELVLDLRIVADAGFLGLPNAGKSTLLRALTAATPKVADYPFTTLQPHLGVVEADERRIVLADLPGLIEGAAEGRGLGTRFLRHAQRCALLCLIVDVMSEEPTQDLDSVVAEVEAFDADMAGRIGLVVANKIDLPNADPAQIVAWGRSRSLPVVVASAVRGDGVEEIRGRLVDAVEEARRQLPAAESFAVFRPVSPDRVTVEREGGGWRVTSQRVERLVEMTPLANPRAVRHLQRRLKALGVEAQLAQAGATEGEEVYIAGHAFEFHPEPDRTGRPR